MHVQLANGSRTRFQEDVFVGHCILTCLEYAMQQKNVATFRGDGSDVLVANDEGQEGQQRGRDSTTTTTLTEAGDEIRITAAPTLPTDPASVLQRAAERILSSKKKRPDGSGDDEEDDDNSTGGVVQLVCEKKDNGSAPAYHAMPHTILPPKSLIVPGSFNPPHLGHLRLVRAALQATDCHTAWFELALINADKPPLAVEDVVQRCLRFLDFDESEMPRRWGVLLTNAPLFVQKVELLHPLQVSRSFAPESEPSSTSPSSLLPPLPFVIGTDTLVRLLNPKYYGNSEQAMLDSLSALPCQFVVGGRLEQKKGGGADEDSTPVFVTGKEEVEQISDPELQSKFTLLPDFRMDVSSTEIRKQLEQQQQEQQSSSPNGDDNNKKR